MKKKLFLIVSLLLCVCMLSGCAYLPLLGIDITRLPSAGESTPTAEPVAADTGDTVTISREEYESLMNLRDAIEAIDYASMYYYQDVDKEKMYQYAAAGALLALDDPYTFYYSPEDYAELWEEDEGEYVGIGILISTSYVTNKSTVSRVFDGGGAQAAGVQRGDILYQVEDLLVTPDTISDAVSIMRGTPDTTVHVTFIRGEETIEMDIMRAKVNVTRVKWGKLTDEIGYIALYDFAGDCSEKFTQGAKELVAEGCKGIIIDLRDNGGGWVSDAQSIGDLFLDAGVLCYEIYGDGTKDSYRTYNGKLDVELVVLINENSASSSEILTGALRDRANATIVGVTSFGKGIMQAVLPLSSGAGMQVTVAEYTSPNGNKVHKIGITPDVEIPLPEGDNGMYEFGDLADPQLNAALEAMQEKLAK